MNQNNSGGKGGSAATLEPFVIVISGASGDLTKRKLIPALYNLARQHLLPDGLSIVGSARREMSHDEFRRRMKEAVEQFSGSGPVDSAVWENFARGLHYSAGDFQDAGAWNRLAALLSNLDRDRGTRGNRIFYLATPPSSYFDIIRSLATAGLARPPHGWARIVIEKPFGRDLESALALNREVSGVFREDQIYRIDHYLGKETVQNILVFRFSSGIFEPIWNRRYVDHVQITVAEDLGVETRATYYEEAGALRDMLQSHMLQLLALTAMEPPVVFDAAAVRDEKAKVLRAVPAIAAEEVDRFAVRGQYAEGTVGNNRVVAYRNEPGVRSDSLTETYAAVKLMVENWRWAGVPFYLRTGKRLPRRMTEIVLHFKQAPFPLFGSKAAGQVLPSLLTLRVQPDEGISLRFNAKQPGPAVNIKPVAMDFCYATSFGVKSAEAYERLLLDCMLGDATLFARSDSMEASWSLVGPILDAWQARPREGIPLYAAGSWGPKEAEELLRRDGRCWCEATGALA